MIFLADININAEKGGCNSDVIFVDSVVKSKTLHIL